MKQADLLNLLKKIEKNPELNKKLKIFLGVAFVGVLLTGGLVIWAGIAALNYMASSAGQIVQSPAAQTKIENLKSELQQVPKQIPSLQVNALNCWQTAQSLLAVEPWLAKPLEANLKSLTTACLGAPQKESCEGEGCAQTEA